uniref:60S ribosomal protein L17 n=1 Tax=Gymnochlora stellata TaxID=67809 RepID=B5A4M0_GYMST|nr:60S ribosomal protein L17 [Gymnochlora stellata]
MLASCTLKTNITKIRVSFKNTTEVANAIKKMNLEKAKEFLKNVIDKKNIIPFKKFNNGVGKSPMLRNKVSKQGRFVTKSCILLLKLLINVTTRIRISKNDPNLYYLDKIIVNRNSYRTRTIFRAFGRANRIRSSICSVSIQLKKYEYI